jgi:hypothetical protein
MNDVSLQESCVSDQEIWLPVVGQEGRYEVSNMGRVRSVDRYLWKRPSRRHPDPAGWQQFWPGQMLKPTIGNHGYPVVNFGDAPVLVHRALLEAFVGPCPEGKESLHDDDCKTNCVLRNLRWGTRSENLHDAVRNGGKPLGERAWNSTITEAQAIAVKSMPHLRPREVSKLTGVSSHTICDIRGGKSWKWLDKKEGMG